MMLKKGEKEYYYLYNSQNDVIGLIDSDGKRITDNSTVAPAVIPIQVRTPLCTRSIFPAP